MAEASTITSKKLSGTLCNCHAQSVAPVQPIFVSHAAQRVHEEVLMKRADCKSGCARLSSQLAVAARQGQTSNARSRKGFALPHFIGAGIQRRR
jgi:hypothetical protein